MRKKRMHTGAVILLIVCAIGFLVPHVYACVPYCQSARMIAAIRDHDMNTVKSMLEAGVSPNVPDVPYRGLWKYANSFVESSPDYPLSVACEQGNLEMVNILLEYGADVSLTEQEGFGWSALSSAILNSDKEDSLAIVILLLENGASIDNGQEGWHPLELACGEYISKDQAVEERTAHANRVVAIVKLVKGNYDLNPSATITPLMRAAMNNNHFLVAYLLSIGADPNIRLDDGRTAYDFANNAGYQDIAELLKEAMDNPPVK